jgi:glyoxylate reductase
VRSATCELQRAYATNIHYQLFTLNELMAHVYITRQIPEKGITMLTDAGHTVAMNPEDRVLLKSELIEILVTKPYDAILSLLTDTIDGEVFDVAPQVKIVANYAVGFNNIDLTEAARRGIVVTNTPDALTHTVAEHAIAMLLTLTSRIAEGDRYVRKGKFNGWSPTLLLGTDLKNKTLGLLGAGRIGHDVAHIAKRGLGMNIAYHDLDRSRALESEVDASFCSSIEELLKVSDVVSLHVPLNDGTHHLINLERLECMKPTAYIINTSRGPVIDEKALGTALSKRIIAGAGLDVFEHEPQIEEVLLGLDNVVLTPHIASATHEARDAMAVLAAQAIIDVLKGKKPACCVPIPSCPEGLRVT